jgi:hypothetical protein
MKASIFAISQILFLVASLVQANENKTFDFQLVVTRQDRQMDWWYKIPYRLPPLISVCREVTTGESFLVFPTFINEALEQEAAHVTWSIQSYRPDGEISQSIPDIVGLSGKLDPKGVKISQGLVSMTFKPEDAFGDYRLEVTATDHVANKAVTVVAHISHVPFEMEPENKDFQKWFIEYPVNPRPRDALYHLTHPLHPFIGEKGRVNPSIWLLKTIYENNPFLIEPTVAFYKDKASKKQKQDMLFLFHLLGSVDKLHVERGLQAHVESLEKICIPDPYAEIRSGEQLDLLWSEYFATGSVKPIEHFISALDLGSYAGTLEKIKSGELNKEDPVVIEAARANAIFNAAMWSLQSNCLQSRLLFHYCIGLYETKELSDMQKSCLGIILNAVSKKLQEANASS